MKCSISSIYYSPVKSLSFEKLNFYKIQKNLGIFNDRIFAFTKNINFKKAKLIEEHPTKRKLHHFLTLKNTPILNKYNFKYDGKNLILNKLNKEIVRVSLLHNNQLFLLSKKLVSLENSIENPTFLIFNKSFPFFDTTHSDKISNSISLINLNSVRDFEMKNNIRIEIERFRGNFYISGINAWEERKWINKIVKINNISFKVEKHISRCSATNLQPFTDNVTINLPLSLKKYYNHIDMGVYLTALDEGQINAGDELILDE